MTNEKVQWLILGLVVIGFIGFGGFVMKQNTQLDRVSNTLLALSSDMQTLSQRTAPAMRAQPTTTAASDTRPTSQPSSNQTVTGNADDTWAVYKADRERFQISYPSNLETVLLDTGSSEEGRIGTIGINRTGLGNDDLVSVHVYKNKAALETDFSAWDGGADPDKKVFMGSSGLRRKTATINGKSVTMFYGMHAIDGVGGTEFPEVDAEVIGPTYAYMIQFHGMGTDPDNADIQRYLGSFQAL